VDREIVFDPVPERKDRHQGDAEDGHRGAVGKAEGDVKRVRDHGAKNTHHEDG
jgi:hypothetical protein